MKLQTQTYYDRMLSSLGDKKRILPYLNLNENSTVLDVGGGDGSLVASIKNAYPVVTFNLDAAESSVQRSKANGIPTAVGFADEIHHHYNPLDNIIASSVVHEIFSYGNRNGKIGRIENVKDFLSSAYDSLIDGGRLVIRDGVNPGYELLGKMEFSSSNASAEVEKFLTHSPFTQEGLDRKISIEEVETGVFEGSLSSLMEFAFTYTWGEESFEREVNEFYGVFTLSDLAEMGESVGFKLIHAEKYVQQGYVDNLPEINFFPFFPDTNALWVFEK